MRSRATSSSSVYDLKLLIQNILTSRTYQMPAVARSAEVQSRGYVVQRAGGPADVGGTVRRCHRFDHRRVERLSTASRRAGGGGRGAIPPPTDPPTVGVYGRDWRAASNDLTRALGRPIRDQIISSRPSDLDDAAGAGAGERRTADAAGCRAARSACSANCRQSS